MMLLALGGSCYLALWCLAMAQTGHYRAVWQRSQPVMYRRILLGVGWLVLVSTGVISNQLWAPATGYGWLLTLGMLAITGWLIMLQLTYRPTWLRWQALLALLLSIPLYLS